MALLARHEPAWRGARIEPYQVTWRPGPGRHNVWELVVHAAYWKYVVRKRVSGAPRGGFPPAGSNFFPREGLFNSERWQADLDLLADQHRQLRAMVAALGDADLVRPVGGKPAAWTSVAPAPTTCTTPARFSC